MTNARKKRGRCQIKRESPVRSRIAMTSQAAKKPKKEITKIHGRYRSKNLNSGRFAAGKPLIYSTTTRKLSEFRFCDNEGQQENLH
jgi:hypothetical protein